jgi:APA family basic amino acid/polyamine antiporter
VAATAALATVASAASFAILVYYGIANTAALRMPRRVKLYSDAVPLVGLVSCASLALSLRFPVVMTGIAVLSAGFAFRFIAQPREHRNAAG